MTRAKLVVAGVAAIVMLFATACADDTPRDISGPARTAAPAAAVGSGLEVTDQSDAGITSGFRIAEDNGAGRAPAVSWTVNGKRFVDLSYPNGVADGGRTGRMTLYDKQGNGLLSFDAATRKFIRLKTPRTTGPIAGDFDWNESHDACGDAWVALIGSGSMLTLMLAKGNKEGVLAILPGIYSSWQLVNDYCGWLYREFAYEFMTPILHIGDK